MNTTGRDTSEAQEIARILFKLTGLAPALHLLTWTSAEERSLCVTLLAEICSLDASPQSYLLAGTTPSS